MAGPIRGGGVVKGWPSRKKELILELEKNCHLKIKSYFTLYNLSKYGHITLKFVGR